MCAQHPDNTLPVEVGEFDFPAEVVDEMTRNSVASYHDVVEADGRFW